MVKVLVVDDEDGVRNTLSEFIEKLGYEALSASDGEEALEKMKEGPDVVLLDIMMPDTDGMEILDRIKEMSPSTDVIMVTGLVKHEVGLESRDRGAFEFLTKPIDFEHLKFLLYFKTTQMALNKGQ